MLRFRIFSTFVFIIYVFTNLRALITVGTTLLLLLLLLLLSFLANDVTLVTSYGYCQSLKINEIRDTSVLRSVRLGGYSVRRWVRVCTGTMKPLPYQRH